MDDKNCVNNNAKESKTVNYLHYKKFTMPIDNTQIEDIPNWAVTGTVEAVDEMLTFWKENSDTAYTQEELQEQTDMNIVQAVNIIVGLRQDDIISKKGVYLRPTNIESAYEKWQDIRDQLD